MIIFPQGFKCQQPDGSFVECFSIGTNASPPFSLLDQEPDIYSFKHGLASFSVLCIPREIITYLSLHYEAGIVLNGRPWKTD